MALGVHLNVTYLNVEREPRGTGALSTQLLTLKYEGSSQFLQVVSNTVIVYDSTFFIRLLPHLIIWKFFWCELDYSCKVTNKSGQKHKCFFISQLSLSKSVTTMILIHVCTLYHPPQASKLPYNLFGKSLFSHFHTELPYR